MTASIPPAATLAITAGDIMNYGGTDYVISSVAAGVDNGNGLVTYAVTLTGGRVITVSAKNTILEVPQSGTAGAGSVDRWVQNATL